MRQSLRWLAGLAAVGALAGCRSATRVVEVPRVDLNLSGGGNRGYLLGAPSTTPELSASRRMVEAEIELPPIGRATGRPPAPGADLTDVAPPEMDWGTEDASAWTTASIPQTFDSYTVKKRDTLWSIAADPGIFGDATRWRLLYNANRDALKSPDQLRAGMTLRIPRGEPAGRAEAPAPAEESATWTK